MFTSPISLRYINGDYWLFVFQTLPGGCMVTVEQAINELLFPVFGLVGIVLRVFGALGIGLVAGTILRRSVLREASVRFHTPLIYLATALLVGVMVFGTWSSPGTVALFGIGLFVGYMFLERRSTPTVVEGEVVDVDETASTA